MSSSSIITSFGQAVTVTRTGTGAYSSGTYVPGAETIIGATMSVQPMTGRELLNLPEAQRTRQYVKAYSSIELFTAMSSPSKKADIVTLDGVNYEVQKVEKWESPMGSLSPHWRVEMAEVNP